MTTVDQLRVKTIHDLGFTSLFGATKDYRDLEPAQQSLVTDAMSAYVATHPLEFASGTVTAAQRWNASGIVGQPYADTSFSAAASQFVDEAGKQASSLEENLNPFSEQNRKWVLVVLALAGVVYFFRPQLRAAARKLTAK